MKKVFIILGIILAIAALVGLGAYSIKLNSDVSKIKKETEQKEKIASKERARIKAKNEERKKQDKIEAAKKAKAEKARMARREKLRKLKEAKLPPDPGKAEQVRNDKVTNLNEDKMANVKTYMRTRIRHNAGRSSSETYKPAVPMLGP